MHEAIFMSEKLMSNFGSGELKEYSTIPFFFINESMDLKVIESAIAAQAKKGVRGLILHPRTGLDVPYLSEQFFEKFQKIVEIVKKYKLVCYLYDEYNWPSGVAAGKVTMNVNYRQRFLTYKIFKNISFKKPLNITLDFLKDYKIVAIKLIVKKKKVEDNKDVNKNVVVKNNRQSIKKSSIVEEVLDLTGKIKDNSIQFELKPEEVGTLIIFYTSFYRDELFNTRGSRYILPSYYYVDLLNKDATNYFIELTHEQYKRYCGEEFGKTILGIFTDEPANYKGYM